MKFLGWYSFIITLIAVLVWVPKFLTMSSEWEAGLWVILLFTPVVIYTYKKAVQEK